MTEPRGSDNIVELPWTAYLCTSLYMEKIISL